jgi:hypothetical protein
MTDQLLAIRAQVHGVRMILEQLATGSSNADPIDGAALATQAEDNINSLLERITP